MMFPGLLGILSAVLPAFTSPISAVGTAVANRIMGIRPGDPQNVGERVQLMQAETAKLQALYSMDSGGESYKWVEAIRKLQRPLVIAVVMYAFIVTNVYGYASADMAAQVAAIAEIVFGYLFGERATLYLRGKAK